MFREPDESGFRPGIEERYNDLVESHDKDAPEEEPRDWVDFCVFCPGTALWPDYTVRKWATKIGEGLYTVEPFTMEKIHGCMMLVTVSWTDDQPDEIDLRREVGCCVHGDLELNRVEIATGRYIRIRAEGTTEGP